MAYSILNYIRRHFFKCFLVCCSTNCVFNKCPKLMFFERWNDGFRTLVEVRSFVFKSSGWNDLSVFHAFVKSWGWNDLSVFDGLAKKNQGETICLLLLVRWMIDTRFWVSLILGYWYHGIIDTRFWVSLILGYWYQMVSGYHWYLVLGIVDTWILVSGYHWYSVWGIIDTRFWVSLILGSGYRWYLDTGIWVSLITGLGICG